MCHWCLTKMVEDSKFKGKLYYAFTAMAMPGNNTRVVPTWLLEMTKKNRAHTEDVKKKMSDSHRMRWEDADLKKKYSENRLGEKSSFYGCSHTAQTKTKISMNRKAAVTDENRQRSSEVHSNKIITNEHRNAISKKMKGKPKSEEQKRKMSLAAKARWDKIKATA